QLQLAAISNPRKRFSILSFFLAVGGMRIVISSIFLFRFFFSHARRPEKKRIPTGSRPWRWLFKIKIVRLDGQIFNVNNFFIFFFGFLIFSFLIHYVSYVILLYF